MNRCISIIKEVEREQEHEKRCARVQRSRDVELDAMKEANANGITMSCDGVSYELSDNRHVIAFYPITNTVFRKRYGEKVMSRVEINAETDVLSVVLMFCEGRFL